MNCYRSGRKHNFGRVQAYPLALTEHGMQIRVLISAGEASRRWDLCCRVREAMIDFVQREYPQYLPRVRAEIRHEERHAASTEPAPPPVHAGLGDSTAIKQPSSLEVPTSVP